MNCLLLVGQSDDVLDILDYIDNNNIILEEFLKITLIDDIIGAFFKQYAISSLLNDVDKFTSKLIVPYTFKNVTYDGTLYNYRSGYPQIYNQLTIRLSHDGFRYKKIDNKYILAKVKNRNTSGWLILNEQYLKDMINLKKIASRLKTTIKFLYNPHLKRIDIEFLLLETKKCILKLTFEHGNSKYEDKDDYYLNLN